MSNDDRDVPEFDDFDLPDEKLKPGDAAAQPTDDMIEPTEEMAPPVEETIQPVDGTVGEGFAAGEAPTEDMMAPMAIGGQGGEAGESSTESGEEEKKKKKKGKKKKENKEGLLHNLRNASPYTVMLGISLVAILIAVCFLWLELGTYNNDIKAKEAKQRVGAAPAVQLGSPSTTATA